MKLKHGMNWISVKNLYVSVVDIDVNIPLKLAYLLFLLFCFAELVVSLIY